MIFRKQKLTKEQQAILRDETAKRARFADECRRRAAALGVTEEQYMAGLARMAAESAQR